MDPQLMGPAGLRQKGYQSEAVTGSQYPVMGDCRGAVRADAPPDRGSLVPADGGVNGAGAAGRCAHAYRQIFPPEAVCMKAAAQQVMDISALGDHHQPGGAFVQPVDGMKDELRAPDKGQGPRHGGGIRQEIGGVGGHSGGLVHHQQMAVLPDDGKGPVAGNGLHPGRAVIAGFHR